MSTIAESILIFGFPGTGKTYAFEHQEELGLNLADSDSSNFHWVLDDDFKPVLDEDGKKIPHPAWPKNYVQYIELIGREQEVKPDYIFVSTHDEVMKALLPLNFTSFVIVPDIALKDRYMELYKKRGSSEEFIQLMNKNFEKFVTDVIVNSLSDDSFSTMLVQIREASKIQNVTDLVTRRIGMPMEFDKE